MISSREMLVHEQVAGYLRLQYPNVLFHFDMAGVNLDRGRVRAMFSRLNSRAWPDLFIAKPNNGYHGLFLELKREDAHVFKRDGSLVANKHIQEQGGVLEWLRQAGYETQFAIGFDRARAIIDLYLGGKKEAEDGRQF